MPTKSALQSKGVWGGAVATLAGIVSFFHTVNLVGFAQAFVDNYPAILAAGGGILAAYGRIRASALIAPPAGTAAANLVRIALVSALFGLSSCSTLGIGGSLTSDETRSLTSIAVSNGLQFGIKDAAQRSAVAKQMVGAIDIYNTYSGGSVPTPEQFQALLNSYLPSGSTKALTVSNLTALYTLRYSSFKDVKLPSQVAFVNSFLLGVKDGAWPFVAPITLIQNSPALESLIALIP